MDQEFDYVILGAGLGGLSIAALLANDGHTVCVVEGYSKPGGFAHTLSIGDYSFCHEIQYLMGCGPEGPVTRFLKTVDLDGEVTFNELGPRLFDLVSIRNTKVGIPHGWEHFHRELRKLYPECASALDRYFQVLISIYSEAEPNAHIISKWDILLGPFKHGTLLKYRNYTLHDFFEELDLPQELRAILAGQADNLSASPSQVSLLMHAAMQVAYCTSAHFPSKGMGHFIDSIVEKITENEENRLLLNQAVDGIHANSGGVVERVSTSAGDIRGKHFISNIDPRRTAKLIRGFEIPERYARRLGYEYSDSVFTLYLGLTNIDLTKHGFGKFNIWHHAEFDVDDEFTREIKRDDYSRPWVFISTPSLYADPGTLAPNTGATMEVLTFVNYDHFKHLYDTDRKGFAKSRAQLEKLLLDVVEKNYLPGIRKHVDKKIVHTPIDVEQMLHVPKGNVYGASLTPAHYNLNRITSDTPLKNLSLVGATSAYPGTMGVILGSLTLHEKLKREANYA